MADRVPFVHVLDKHGLWKEVRVTPPRDVFGPLVNLGLLQTMEWAGEQPTRDFINEAAPDELAMFIALLAPIGQEFVDWKQQEQARQQWLEAAIKLVKIVNV